MHRLVILAFVLAFVFSAGAAHSAILYVNHAATGANDGTSWADAYTDLQAALAAMSDGDEVWVAAGTYYPTATADRWAAFEFEGNKKLYGCFAGTETDAAQRDIDSNPTILSGNIGDPGTYADNSYTVVSIHYPDSNTVFDGFTVRDGYASAGMMPVQGVGGGGMIIMDMSLLVGAVKIRNVTFRDNRAGRGGAVYIEGLTNGSIYAEVEFEDVSFYDNTATGDYFAAWGGAIYTIDADVSITGARFFGGNAAYGGGACFEWGHVYLYNVLFHGNSASYGGGLNTYLCSAFVANTTFTGNAATTGGGGIYSHQATLSLVNVVMWDDSSPGGPEIRYESIPPGISYSLVEGCGEGIFWDSSLGTDNGNNIDRDPLFLDPSSDDFRLDDCSMAVNAGYSAVPGLPSTDLDGGPRIVGPAVDMGAFENQTAVLDTVLFVDASATGAGDGSSWADAFNDLQDALAAAVLCPVIDQIWVAAGTYFPTTGTYRNARFELRSGLVIYGGFAGWESLLSERDIENNLTILSGEIGAPGTSDNTYNIVWAVGAGTDSTAVLDGFTVTAAAYTDGWSRGAVFCYDDSEPIFRNLRIVDNAGTGLNSYDARPETYDSEISGNAASGIYIQENSVAQFFDVLISGNGDSGVHIGYGTTVWLKNAVVSGNQAVDGGGFFVEDEAHLVILGALITGNTASNDGGGIYSAGSGGAVTLVNITMSDNVAVRGGGIYNGQGFYTIPLYNSIMWGDSATSEGDEFYTELTSYNAFYNSIVEGCGGSGPGWTDTLNYDGGGNLDVDPWFADEAGGDFRLTPCSPAVEAFDTTGWGYSKYLPATDLDGNPRVAHDWIDMGGYEYQGPLSSPVLYVDQSAAGAGDGSSWADAYPQLRDALAYAGTCDRITEIWVAAGTYTPTEGTDRTATFTLRNNLALYGGFTGTESLLSERDAETNVTVLSGEIGAGSLDDNSYHVLWGDSLDTTAILDGFTVTRGYADATIPHCVGAGIFAGWFSGPAITGVRFVDNHAVSSGGGLYANGPVQLTGVVFENNSAGEGGGATIIAAGSVRETEFIGNTATYNGGALLTGSSIRHFIENVTFSGNSAANGGAVYIQTQDTLAFTNVVFDRNTAANGGAIYNNFGGFEALNTSWSGNSATGSGGGIYNQTYTFFAPISIVNSIMWGDSAATGPEIHNVYQAPSISYSLVEGSGGSGGGWNPAIGADGGGNLDADPLYVDPLTGDLRPGSGSPAIDAGNSAAPGLPATDLAGALRINGADVDMGAYEYYVAGKSATIIVDKTGEEIYFISDLDTLAVINFTSEELDSVKVIMVKETPPNIKEGSDWVPIHYIFEAFPSDAAFEAWLKVFYGQEDFDASGLTDESLLALWRYDETTSSWEYKESVADIDKNSLVAAEITKFSVWGITNSQNAVDVDEENIMPKGYVLHQNRPNPFNPSTMIEYQLPETGHVELTIYDALGRRIVTLVDGPQTAGYKSVMWNGQDRSGAQAASGVYFYRLRAGSFAESKKMILLR